MCALDCFAKHVGRVVKDLVGRHQVVLLVNTAGIHVAMVVGDDAVLYPVLSHDDRIGMTKTTKR